jgi:uncharacterized protein YndB with AHSA1/START domain
MDVPDSIRKELALEAPRERVWRALTDATDLARWFPSRSAEIDLRPGGAMQLSWEDDEAEGIVEEVTPGERLVFRWRLRSSSKPYTRVTVDVDDLPDGRTRLVLVEDGFSALADDERDEMIAGNTQGWTEELEELRVLVEAPAA